MEKSFVTNSPNITNIPIHRY